MDKDDIYINAHLSGTEILWIDIMFVPEEQRGKGKGTAFYEDWEQFIPKTAKIIKLMAADTGNGESSGFWEKMGFSFVYDSETELGHETAQMMWKGVNGHSTPKSIFIEI